ncbi:MAG TPA: lytic transglycosylase domain-containing protein [bacterium]|nr:lytic transglycosylase domain-containing protein [bacterium]
MRDRRARRAAALLAAALALLAAAGLPAAAQESGEEVASTQAVMKSRPEVMPESMPVAFQQEITLSHELARIESDYMNVVRYYNKNLPERQALNIARYVLHYSTAMKVDPRLVMSVIVIESRFQPNAVSPKGAMGLGQLMPGTAAMLGVRNAFDPRENIYGTVKYLSDQYRRWQNSERALELALASYNAGPEAVARHKGIPPYRETIDYVAKVKKLYTFFVYGR